MIYCGLSEEDLCTILDGCYSERQDLVTRIRKTQAAMDRVARNCHVRPNSGMTRDDALEAIETWIPGNSETIEADDGSLADAVFVGDLLEKIAELREQRKKP